MLPEGWQFVIGAVGILMVYCLAMWAYWTWRGRREDRELDAIEARLFLVALQLRNMQRRVGEQHVHVDVDELELRAHMDYDAYRFGYRLPGERP